MPLRNHRGVDISGDEALIKNNVIIKVTYCFKIVISEKFIPIYIGNYCLRPGVLVKMFSSSNFCSGGAQFDSWAGYM
jgi:hypothetical protein